MQRSTISQEPIWFWSVTISKPPSLAAAVRASTIELPSDTFRIVKGLFGIVPGAPVCRAVDIGRNVISYVILPLMAILICVFYDKLKGKATGKGK